MIPNRDQVNILIRVVLTSLMFYYASMAWSFSNGSLSVVRYGGALASGGFWTVAYTIASFSIFCALLRGSTGRLLLTALGINVLVTIMWMVTRTVISIVTHLDYSGSFNALAWLVVLGVIAFVQGLVNPADDTIERWFARYITARLFHWKGGREKDVADGHPGIGNPDSGSGGVSGHGTNRTR